MANLAALKAPYPWWQATHEKWLSSVAQNKLAPAALIVGAKASGKLELVTTWAQLLLCEQPNFDVEPGYCNTCTSCTLFNAKTHPDLTIADLSGSNQLTVDAVRGVIDFLQLSATRGGFRVAIINHADHLNAAAANALLKSLEEPPPKRFICLIAEDISQLPLTLRSRLNVFNLGAVTLAKLKQWLKVEAADLDRLQLLHHLMGDSIKLIEANLKDDGFLAARERLKQHLQLDNEADLASLATNLLNEYDLKDLLYVWLSVAQDLLKVKLRLQEPFNLDLIDVINALSKGANLTKLLAFIDWLQEVLKQLVLNLNAPLVIETLLFKWQNLI